jgi:hypothetical protein
MEHLFFPRHGDEEMDMGSMGVLLFSLSLHPVPLTLFPPFFDGKRAE